MSDPHSPQRRGWVEEPEEHVEHGDDEGWLVSYADMMTLLFGFFAMLFTFATFDDDSLLKVKKELARYFGGIHANAKPGAGNAAVETQPNGALDAEALGDSARRSLANEPGLKVTKDGLEVTFVTTVDFKPGGAELYPEAKESLRALAQIVKDIAGAQPKKPEIRVEGHTDDTPLGRGGPFRSNWELSAARAGAVALELEEAGIPSHLLSAAGYGSSRPAYPNFNPDGKPNAENRAKNRRVLVKVILPEEENPEK